MMSPLNIPAVEPLDPGANFDSPFCALCDELFTATDLIADTTWGPMHVECADSHDELDVEA